MAPRGLGTRNGALRAHSRNASGGSSKVGLNLHFTAAKDPATVQKTGKKSAHHGQDNQRTQSPYPRSTSAVRTTHEPPPRSGTPNRQPKSKPGFSLATSEPDDENEGDWVSSGAATPADGEEEEPEEATTPVDQSQPTLPTADDFHANNSKPAPSIPRTSTARPNEMLNRVATARPETLAQVHAPPVQTRTAPLPPIMTDLPPPVRLSQLEQRQLPQVARQPQAPLPPRQPRKPTAVVERQVPVIVQPAAPQNQPRQHHNGDRQHLHQRTKSEVMHSQRQETEQRPVRKQAVTRPPSLHTTQPVMAPSIHSASGSRTDLTALRPHPLIRGQSYGQSIAHHSSRPTPLATVNSEVVTSSPPGTNGNLSASPGSSHTAGSPGTPGLLNRRLSTASAATLPVPGHDRTRTMSTMSASSSSYMNLKSHPTPSFAALTSLAHPTHPPTPQMVTYFPTPNPHINLELIHPLLPPPYLPTHLTVIEHRNPMRESWERVMRAKRGVQ